MSDLPVCHPVPVRGVVAVRSPLAPAAATDSTTSSERRIAVLVNRAAGAAAGPDRAESIRAAFARQGVSVRVDEIDRDRRRSDDDAVSAPIPLDAGRALRARPEAGRVSRSILHISDVHFGSDHARARAKTLIAVMEAIHPDDVVVSGDLTQRARSAQFGEARAFLDEIRVPRVVVPGNHDVPLWNVSKRFVSPLSKWRRWMRTEPTSLYVDRDVAIVGIDTTRRFGIKGGLVGSSEVREAEEQRGDVPERACRVVVGHHPLATLSRAAAGDSAMGGRRALARLAALGVGLILSGHLHETHVFHPVDRSTGVAGGVLLVNAGTATSHRGRRTEAHADSFNVIIVEARRIGVTTYLHTQRGETFVAGGLAWFPRTNVARTRGRHVPAAP